MRFNISLRATLASEIRTCTSVWQSLSSCYISTCATFLTDILSLNKITKQHSLKGLSKQVLNIQSTEYQKVKMKFTGLPGLYLWGLPGNIRMRKYHTVFSEIIKYPSTEIVFENEFLCKQLKTNWIGCYYFYQLRSELSQLKTSVTVYDIGPTLIKKKVVILTISLHKFSWASCWLITASALPACPESSVPCAAQRKSSR